MPRVPERILEGSKPIAVELIGDRPLDLRASGDRLLRDGVDVLDVHVRAHRRAPELLRRVRIVIRELVGEHDDRVADPDLGVPDLPIRRPVAEELGGAERLPVELEGALAPVDDQIGRDGVVPVGNLLDRHALPPIWDLRDGCILAFLSYRRAATERSRDRCCAGAPSSVLARRRGMIPLEGRTVIVWGATQPARAGAAG